MSGACLFQNSSRAARSLDPWCATHERSASRCQEYAQQRIAELDAKLSASMRDTIDLAFVSGFNARFGESGEGWNAEYPFGQLRTGDHATEAARRLDETRAGSLRDYWDSLRKEEP